MFNRRREEKIPSRLGEARNKRYRSLSVNRYDKKWCVWVMGSTVSLKTPPVPPCKASNALERGLDFII